jgi:transposase-like protein
MSCQTMKEAYAVRRTVPPSAEIQASIEELLSKGMVDEPQRVLSELARLGARLIIQRAVEDEFDTWLGRARYERRPERQRGLRNGFRPRRLQTAEGELRIEIPQAREAAMPFVSKLFPKWHCKRLLRTDPLKALIIGGFVRGLSMRDIESLCEEAGLGKTSRSTVSRVCAELHERFEAFKHRSLYDVNLVVLFLDAIYLPVRPSGPKEGVICAWGITENGERALVSVRLGMREGKEDWLELGRDLTSRGLATPRLIVADGAPGLISAAEEIWPRADRQHCAVHRLRNLQAKLPKADHDRIRFNYWSALTDATGVKDGKLRLQVLISELEHAGYESDRALPRRRPRRARRAPALPAQAPRTLAINEPPRTIARRSPPAHQSDGPLPRRNQLPDAGLGRARPVLHPRQQRRHVHRRRPPTPLPNQVPTSRPRHPRRGGHRRLDSTTGTQTASQFTAAKRRNPQSGDRPARRQQQDQRRRSDQGESERVAGVFGGRSMDVALAVSSCWSGSVAAPGPRVVQGAVVPG